jgi:hypothetical protein
VQLDPLNSQLYNISANFVSKNVALVVDEVFSIASSAIMQVASIDPSLNKITAGVTLVGMGAIGMTRSHIIDKLKEVITGKELSEDKVPNYRLAAVSSGAMMLGAMQIYIGAMEFYQRIMPTSTTINPIISTESSPGNGSDERSTERFTLEKNDEFLTSLQPGVNSTAANNTVVNNEESQKTMTRINMLVLSSPEFSPSCYKESFIIRNEKCSDKITCDLIESRAIQNKGRFSISYGTIYNSDICDALTKYRYEHDGLKPDVLELFVHGSPISIEPSSSYSALLGKYVSGRELTVDDLYSDTRLISCIKRNLEPDSQIFLKSCSTGRNTNATYFDNYHRKKDLSDYPKNFAQALADLTGHVVHAPTYDLYVSQCKVDWDDEKNRAKYSCIPNQMNLGLMHYFTTENVAGQLITSIELVDKYLDKEVIATFLPSSEQS